jgi:hypothetical protein
LYAAVLTGICLDAACSCHNGVETPGAVAGLRLATTADKKHHRAATDRCLCGVAANLSTASAQARELPVEACRATACTGDRHEWALLHFLRPC